MVIYGWGTTEIRSKRPKEIECFECGSKRQMFVRSFVKTWHFYYIPIFPYAIWQEVSCVRCLTTVAFKDMSPPLKEQYKPYRKIPIPAPWHFSGVLIVLGLISWAMIANRADRQEILRRAESIEANTIIEYKISDGAYSTFLVSKVSGHSIFVRENRFEVRKQELVHNIQGPGYYGLDTLIISMDTLIQWVHNDKVTGIYW